MHGQTRGITREPVQRGLIESVDQAREQPGFVFGQRYQGANRFDGHSVWTSKYGRVHRMGAGPGTERSVGYMQMRLLANS